MTALLLDGVWMATIPPVRSRQEMGRETSGAQLGSELRLSGNALIESFR